MAVIWLLVVATGATIMMRHQGTAGSTGHTPDTWPVDSQLPRAEGRATLIMFAHPHCPCTRASINELNRVMARCAQRVDTHVLFLWPEGKTHSWVETDTWRTAGSIPGVQVHEDISGQQARRFGARTSGYVTLYAPNGRLLFRGGITAGRGHAGDNAGADAVVALVSGKTHIDSTPVYGCALFKPCPEQLVCGK